MNMQELRQKAGEMGLQGLGKLRKADLIRQIQQAEGNNACYGAQWRQECGEMDCCWRSDCLRE